MRPHRLAGTTVLHLSTFPSQELQSQLTAIVSSSLPPASTSYGSAKQSELSSLISSVVSGPASSSAVDLAGRWRLAYTTSALSPPAGYCDFDVIFDAEGTIVNRITFRGSRWIERLEQVGEWTVDSANRVVFSPKGLRVSVFGRDVGLGKGRGGRIDVCWAGGRVIVERGTGGDGWNCFLKVE